MSNSELDRRMVSFAQAEGQEALPTQLKTKQISAELRAYIWKELYESFEEYATCDAGIYPRTYYVSGCWEEILTNWWVVREYKFIDEFDNRFNTWISHLKSRVSSGTYIDIFDLLQFVIRHPSCPHDFSQRIEAALEKGRAAYRIHDQTIFPISSEADALVVRSAFKLSEELGLQGTRAHLRESGANLAKGLWADSVRESIHSVESALKVIEPTASTLGAALLKLEKGGRLNPNLKRAMNALYDFTSDEDGIRHAKVLEDTNVGEADAMYMFGVCSAFITFLCLRLTG